MNYKNTSEILDYIGPLNAIRFTEDDKKLLKGSLAESKFGSGNYSYNSIEVFDNRRKSDQIELHVYTETGDYIGSEHQVQNWSHTTDERGIRKVKLDVHNDIRRLNFARGNFKFVYNFNRNLIGSANTEEKLFIAEVSPSRRELLVRLTDPKSTYLQNQVRYFNTQVLNNNLAISRLNRQIELAMNFGNNNIIKVINIRVQPNRQEFLVKLYEPLPGEFDTNIQFWLITELMRPYTDNIHLIPMAEKATGRVIKPANYDIEVDDWKSSETDLKNWNDLLGSNSTTSQLLIDNFFSGSGININVNYGQFENFINFSSAEERVKNYKYKIDLVEYYDNEINTLNTYSGSLGTNRTNLTTLKTNLITGFDGFEKHLYYGFSSSLFTHASESVDYEPHPKQNTEYPYVRYSTTSSQFINWYNDILDEAVAYDLDNENALRKTIPAHIADDTLNESYVLYMDMIGQHFDTIWTYIKHLKDIYTRDEHPKLGLSNQLLYNVAKSYGWTLSHGKQTEELWKYTLGVDENNNMMTSGSGEEQTLSGERRTHEVWRRIVNNLPYILKSKGTDRSVRALIACYGIPESVLSIREYGGPQTDDFQPDYKYSKYETLLEVGGSSYITVPWRDLTSNGFKPGTIEVSFKTKPEEIHSYQSNTLFQLGSGPNPRMMVTFEPTSSESERGNITLHLRDGSTSYISTSIDDVYLFNGQYHVLAVKRDVVDNTSTTDQKYTLELRSTKYGKVFLNESAELIVSGSLGGGIPAYNTSWLTDNTLYAGYGNNPINTDGFSGSIFSIKYWGNTLNSEAITNHVESLRAYNSNNVTSSYNDLGFRVDFNNGQIDYSTTSSLVSDHPNKNWTTFDDGTPLSANLFNITNANKDYQTINYNMQGISVGGNTVYSNKVRVESSTLTEELSIDKRSEVGAYDKYPNDSNRLAVVFSPQNIINEDILESFGNYSIDDFIGDPRDQQKVRYEPLKKLSEEYWKKYTRPNDFVAYIRVFQEYDFSIFNQIKQTLLSRSNKVLGLLIEPNILERSKAPSPKDPTTLNISREIELFKSGGLETNAIIKDKLRLDIDTVNPDLALKRSKNNINIEAQEPVYTLKQSKNYINITENLLETLGATYIQREFEVADISPVSSYNKTNFSKISGTWQSSSNPYYINSITGSSILNYKTYSIVNTIQKYYSSLLSASLDLPYSSSTEQSSVEPMKNLPIGIQRNRYIGCNITATDFNIDSPNTPDGGPIVEIIPVEGKRLITKELDETGNLEIE